MGTGTRVTFYKDCSDDPFTAMDSETSFTPQRCACFDLSVYTVGISGFSFLVDPRLVALYANDGVWKFGTSRGCISLLTY